MKLVRHIGQDRGWLLVVDVDGVGDDSENEEFGDTVVLLRESKCGRLIEISDVSVEDDESVGVMTLAVFSAVFEPRWVLSGVIGAEARL